MKQLGVFTQDGFKGSIELLKFLREMNNDIAVILSAIVGTSTVFIKGGLITQSGGSTTITDGIIFKDGKFYYFTGSTAVGTPTTLKVLFTTTTAAGYPLPTYVGNPIGADIYLDNTAKIDSTGAIFLNAIGTIYDLQALKTKADLIPTKAGKNAYIDISSTIVVNSAFSVIFLTAREYEDGTIYISVLLSHTTTIALNTAILTNIPNIGFMTVSAISVADTTRTVKDIYCIASTVTNYFTTIPIIATPPLVTNLGFTIMYKK